jgi:hypothetical protein
VPSSYYGPEYYLNSSIRPEGIVGAKPFSSLEVATVGAAFQMVFSSKPYAALAATVAVAFWIVFNILDGLLLISPLNFYYPIPADAVPGFVLSRVTAALVGIVVSMNVYLFKNMAAKGGRSSFLSGSTLETVSSMCASCSSVGFYLAATFGTAGVAASTFFFKLPAPAQAACHRIAGLGVLFCA